MCYIKKHSYRCVLDPNDEGLIIVLTVLIHFRVKGDVEVVMH